jgi:hypothetical protein
MSLLPRRVILAAFLGATLSTQSAEISAKSAERGGATTAIRAGEVASVALLGQWIPTWFPKAPVLPPPKGEVMVNNLVHGEILLEGGEAHLRTNLTGRLDNYFVDPSSGNLALTSAATRAIDHAVPLPEVTEDKPYGVPASEALGFWLNGGVLPE